MGRAKALSLKTATGLYLGQGVVVRSVVARTPLGVKELECERIPLDGRPLAEVIGALQADKKISGQIACGVDSRRFYLITRPPPPLDDEEDLEETLAGGLARMPGGLVSATTPVRLPGQPMVTMAAASADLARDALEGLGGIKEKRLLLTGVPLALHRLARLAKKSSRKQPVEVRVFLAGDEGMAVLAWHGTPIALHVFDCPHDRRVRALEFATRNLQARAADTLGLKGVDVVYLHVGEEAGELASTTQAASGVKTVAAPELAADPESVANSLATLALQPRPKGFHNLFDKVFEPAGFVKNFPVVAALMLFAMVGGSAFMFGHVRSTLEAEAKALRKKAKANYESVGIRKDDLKKQHDALKEEYRLANYFIADRAFWGDMLKDLPDLVPDTMTVEDVDGRDTVRFPRKKQSGAAITGKLRQLSLAAIAPVEPGVPSPPELDQLTTAILGCENITELFPRISTSNVRLMPGVAQPMARILITTSP